MVAIKLIEQVYKTLDDVQNLHEIQWLQHQLTIVNLIEILYDGGSGRLALVMELMSCNIYEII